MVRNIIKSFLLLLVTLTVTAQTNVLEEAKRLLSSKDYTNARRILQTVLNNPEENRASVASSLYLLGKTELAEQNFDQAKKYFQNLTQGHSDSGYFEEATYQLARIPYLQKEYENAINTLGAFITAHPSSSYVANAYYWVGESLLEFGELIEARKMFQVILKKYPTSYRVEAAQYRLDLIVLSLRERELRKLLLASHEQIHTLTNQLVQMQSEYDALIELYEDIANNKVGDTELAIQYAEQKRESEELKNQLMNLQDQIQMIFETIDEAREQSN